ncbi:citramalate synthase [Desulfatirhabdium butyrativorans]|uniref:citramalate synthase n=1 Tax=Desulfatirhabdium butyrativorans TaxID=340467 RepID=UPI00048278F7|nr:citramalate synthase [Desulfatirhabdium butyrativorans]
MKSVLLYDTTLRDGTQGESVCFTAEEKLAIAMRLDEFGIHYIEGGWPGSNPKDMQFFELAGRVSFKHAKIAAFGSTRRAGISPAEDANLRALLESGAPVVTIFGKSWTLHVEEIMGNTLEENLAMIADSIAFLKAAGREVIYDAEHFFDGYEQDSAYALRTLEAAYRSGADAVVLCDTNGGTLPDRVARIVAEVREGFSKWNGRQVRLGIHTHDDCGLAVANSLAAVQAGADMVQGTINGFGERCGNADLTTIIPVLCLKMHVDCLPEGRLERLKRLSRFVDETANMIPRNARPFVGKSAFAHKGGVHVSAIRKNPRAYEHIDPERVGNKRHVLVSDMSGRSNIEYKARELGVELNGNGLDAQKIVAEIKKMEQEGYQFDTADGSFKLLLQRFTDQYQPLFDLEAFRITIEKDKDRPCSAHATIKISVEGRNEITAAEGNGPVSALDNALRKALDKFYPNLDRMRLVDFKVRVIDGRLGTAAKVRVSIESRDEDHVWSTIGVSEDIIEASWQALADSFQYKLARNTDTGAKAFP